MLSHNSCTYLNHSSFILNLDWFEIVVSSIMKIPSCTPEGISCSIQSLSCFQMLIFWIPLFLTGSRFPCAAVFVIFHHSISNFDLANHAFHPPSFLFIQSFSASVFHLFPKNSDDFTSSFLNAWLSKVLIVHQATFSLVKLYHYFSVLLNSIFINC